MKYSVAKLWVIWTLFAVVQSIYAPNEIDQTPPRPYTTGIKIKSSHYKTMSEPYYHTNYSKVYVHNKNYTSSFLDDTRADSESQATKLHPVYISENKKDKINSVLKEHNTNVVEKNTLNNRVVYKRRIEKSKNIEVFNKCPPGSTGQFVYDLSCNQFLDCWNGRGGPRNCAPGTLFNPKTLECDFPEKVECLTGPTGSSITLKKSAKLQLYEQAKCPEDFSGLIPNYTDCSKFVQCNNGIQTPRDCPPGTLFDTNLNVCNHAKETTCFSGQKVGSSGIREEYGGSADTTGLYQAGQYTYGGYNQFIGQQQGQGSAYGVPHHNHLGHGTGVHYHPQGHQQASSGCDPTNPYCKSGGYVISGQNIYNNIYSRTPPTASQGEPCNPQLLTCQENIAYIQPGQGQPQESSKPTVYIKYVMCNPSEEDCSTFQQGTFKMGPGGALCNPANQQCGDTIVYLPGTPNDLPAGTYFVKYVICNTMQEDCAPYQRGIVEANYGVPGTLIGAHPVEDSGVSSSGCNPQTQNCSTNQYPTSYRPISGAHGKSGQPCNPQYQECGQSQGNINYNQGQQRPSESHGQPCDPRYQKCGQGQGSVIYSRGQQGPSLSPGQPCDPRYRECGQGQGSVIYHRGQQEPSLSPGQPCDPRYQECGSVYSQGQQRPTIFPGGQPCNPQYQVCSNQTFGFNNYNDSCNPQIQNCGNVYYQGSNRTQLPGSREFSSAPGYNQPISPTYNRTNFKKVCAAGDENCYGTHPSSPDGIKIEAKCPSGFQGVTKHPTDCKKFLNCANGITYIQDCGPGTLFNPVLNTCDYSYNVDCKDEDGTTTLGYEQDRGEYGGQQAPYGNVQGYSGCQGQACQGRAPCQGSHCTGFGRPQETTDTETTPYQGQTGCRGYQCSPNHGQRRADGQGQGEEYRDEVKPFVTTTVRPYTWLTRPQSIPAGHSFDRQGPTTYHGQQRDCQGYHCNPNQGSRPVENHGQVQDYEDEAKPLTSTLRTHAWPTRRQSTQGDGHSFDSQGPSSEPEQNSHVMKIPTKKGHQSAQPINKSDRVTSGGFNNRKSIDYVDIFDPDETRNLGYATTTQRGPKKPQKQVWPPPFPDLATTDPYADYVFEYEDGEPVTLAPENVQQIEKRRKSRCGNNDFMCDKRSCIAKNFVCDGVADCDDGKDEKYCQKYLDDFKPYKNSRLDVLEKQRWDNVSYSTCALLCMDNRKFECKSFNYRKSDRACFLTNENIGSSGALREYYPCDYYERKSTSLDCMDMHKCPSGKCLTSDQVCDGYDDCGDRADEKGCRPEDFGYSVKLAAGEESHEGRIEVTVFGRTGYICDDGFSITDANVLCKELGFKLGALEVKGNSYYAKDLNENNTLYMMDDIECLGNETSLMQCDFAGWGIHNCADREIAGVICKTPQETCSEGYWKCDTGNECVRMPFLCDGLYDCTDNSDEASHICDLPTAIRLVNGSRQSEGRLEVRHHGIWGSVCDDDFNEDAAKIVCNTLGFSGSVAVKKDAYFGESTGPIWLDQVSCKGNESSIEKCTHWDWGEHNCDHSEDVGVVCSNNYFIVEPKRNSKNYVGGVSGSVKDLDTSNSSPEPVSCGYRKDNIFLQSDDVHFRVVQGSLAKPGDYPWQAALRIKGTDKSAHWCGAVVIASKWVLTAAHCLEGYPKGAYVVVAGEYNIDENEGTEQQAYIEEYYLHENFRKGHKMGNDIAMVLLKGHGFKLNQDIQPICLPDEDTDYERDLNCTISGFGTVQTGRSAYSHKLRAAWIPIQKMDVCKMAHIYGENIGEGMICAGDLTGGIDACDGDSGGPLACLNDGVFTLYGITSWGQRCGYANKPGVYVKVSYYRKWIEHIMKLHS